MYVAKSEQKIVWSSLSNKYKNNMSKQIVIPVLKSLGIPS